MAAAVPAVPPGHAVAASGMKNGFGITALCCGVVGIVVGLVPFAFPVSVALGACGIVFGSLGFLRAKRGEASNRGMALAGLITGIVAAAMAIIGFIFLLVGLTTVTGDLDSYNYASPASPTATHSVFYQMDRMAHQGLFIGNG